MYNYGIIGNCNISGLISKTGSLDWLCLPRPDSPPVFGKLLDDNGGFFDISLGKDHNVSFVQNYIINTNILKTEARETSTGKLLYEIFDFCPRFEQYGRTFRPFYLFRTIVPGETSVGIRIRCKPVSGWNKTLVAPDRGNSHLRWEIRGEHLRLTSNAPITYLMEEREFLLTEPIYLALSWGSAIEADLKTVAREFLNKTIQYWQNWVKHCNIPPLYQHQVIRSALTLKLQCFEDTGAILAAPTTSLPEELAGVRNWDYRHCWLRDSFFILTAFRNLGQFQEMEGFLKYLINIVGTYEPEHGRLHPVYSLDLSRPNIEINHENWTGYRKSQPVRAGNQAADHVQNDVYGELLLALAPIYKDERFLPLRNSALEKIIHTLVTYAIKSINIPDASIWEFRGELNVHSFTNLMCWSGLKKLQGIQMHIPGLADLNLNSAIAAAECAIESCLQDNILFAGPFKKILDASALLLPILRYNNHIANRMTVKAIVDSLRVDNTKTNSSFLYRYRSKDDFGTPRSAFLICGFWLVEALHLIGEQKLAATCMDEALTAANHLGLLSEHYDPSSKLQLGNFPQGYSHVGLINAAFTISPKWEEY